MRSLLLILALCAGCAAPPRSPFFGDEKYLRFGVDPRAEADALVQMYAEHAEPLALRIVAHDFTALGFMDRAGRATRVRVVTLRGIALALDPEVGTPLQAAVSYALLAPPLRDTQDADRDGFEEVFIEERTPERTCVQVYRVRDVGYVDRIETTVRAFNRDYCVSSVADADEDGRVELHVAIELVDFELPFPPAIHLNLWPYQHRFTLQGTGDRLAGFVAAQQAAREIELEQAQAENDTTTLRRLAVELAALTQVLGLPTQDQLARFDGALRGVALNAAERGWVQAARERIEQRWRKPPALLAPDAPAAPIATH